MTNLWFGEKTSVSRLEDNRSLEDMIQWYQTQKLDLDVYTPVVPELYCNYNPFSSRKHYLKYLQRLSLALVNTEIDAYSISQELAIISSARLLNHVNATRLIYEENQKILEANQKSSLKESINPKYEHEIIFIHNRISEEFISICEKSKKKLEKILKTEVPHYMPNTSVIAGPIVTAKLLEHGGSLKRLSRIPASVIQVMGAENALYHHIKGGSAPPKHGFIYMIGRVHSSPFHLRGKMARKIAGKIAIALKIDYFRREADLVFLNSVKELLRK